MEHKIAAITKRQYQSDVMFLTKGRKQNKNKKQSPKAIINSKTVTKIKLSMIHLYYAMLRENK